MDNITHALGRAVRHESERQCFEEEAARGQKTLDKGSFDGAPSTAGLQPMRTREVVHQTYAGASPNALHIELRPCGELFTLWLELTSFGLKPPVGMIQDGCDVIMDRGSVEIAATHDGIRPGCWTARLGDGSRGGWKEVTS